MKGSDFLASLPPDSTPEREALIVAACAQGLALPIHWVALTCFYNEHKCVFRVAADVVAIGEPDDWVRVPSSSRGAQRIADALGGCVPTSRVSDLAYANATIRLTPHPQNADAQMMRTDRFVQHHQAIEAERARVAPDQGGAPPEVLHGTVGKDWILSPRLLRFPSQGVNYGWHDQRRGVRGSPIQARGPVTTRPFHEATYTDYSQWSPRLVHPMVTVDGEQRSYAAVLADGELCHLLSDEGPILGEGRVPGV